MLMTSQAHTTNTHMCAHIYTLNTSTAFYFVGHVQNFVHISTVLCTQHAHTHIHAHTKFTLSFLYPGIGVRYT